MTATNLFRWLISLLLLAVAGDAQTRIDLGRQSRNADFRNMPVTMPVRTGAELPATCEPGELFLRLDGAAQADVLFTCTQPNVWSSSLPPQNAQTNRFLSTNGSRGIWRGLVGGASGAIQVGQTSSEAEIDIDTVFLPTKAGTNAWTGLNTYPPTSAQTLNAASAVILCNANAVQVSPASNLTLTSAPTIANGQPGQLCLITNVAATNSVTVQDATLLAGSNLRLSSSSVTLAPGASLLLVFNPVLNDWVEVARPFGGHTHGAGDITSGTLGLARGGTGQSAWVANRCVQVNAAGTALESAPAACGTGSGSGSSFERFVLAARCQATVPGAAFSFDSANAPAPTCQFGTNTPSYATLDWDDVGTKAAYDFLLLPGGSLPVVRVDLAWSTPATTGVVNWRLATACVSGTNPDPPYNPPQTISAPAAATANAITVSTLPSLTLTGCGPGQQMRYRLDRDTTDSLTQTARLHWLRFY